jgi:hypothetical protein
MATLSEDDLSTIDELERTLDKVLLAMPGTGEALALSNKLSSPLRGEPHSAASGEAAAGLARSDAERSLNAVQMVLVKDSKTTVPLATAVDRARDRVARWKQEVQKLASK